MATPVYWTQQPLPGEHPPPVNEGNIKSRGKAFFVLTVKKLRFREAVFRQNVKHLARKAGRKAKDKFEAVFYED